MIFSRAKNLEYPQAVMMAMSTKYGYGGGEAVAMGQGTKFLAGYGVEPHEVYTPRARTRKDGQRMSI